MIILNNVSSFNGASGIDISELHQMIKTDTDLQKKTAHIKTQKGAKYKAAKIQLPALMLNVEDTEGLKDVHINKLSNFLQIDIDTVADNKIGEVIKDLLWLDYVQLVFRSGGGVKAIAVIERTVCELDSAESRRKAKEENLVFYQRINTELEEMGISGSDKGIHDLSRKCYVWHDKGAHLKSETEVQPLKLDKEDWEEHTQSTTKAADAVHGVYEGGNSEVSQELLNEALMLNNADTERQEWLVICIAYAEASFQNGSDAYEIIERLNEFSSHGAKYDDAARKDIRDFVKRTRENIDKPQLAKAGLGSLLREPLKQYDFRQKLNQKRALHGLDDFDLQTEQQSHAKELSITLDTWSQMVTDQVKPVVPVIEALIGVGEKLMLAAPSKMGKTQALLNLAKAAGKGGSWFGFPIKKMTVLYINFEFTRERMSERISNLEGFPDNVKLLHLRGRTFTSNQLISSILKLGLKFDLVIIDPVYKLLGGIDENSNTEVAQLLAEIERIGTSMGAAIVFAHHFSKGGKKGVAQLDRASGAGVWARDPDAIMTFTEHVEDSCYTLESTVRNYSSPEKSVWQSDFPHFRQVCFDPEETRGRGGSNAKGSKKSVVEFITNTATKKCNKSELLQGLSKTLKVTQRTVSRWLKAAIDGGSVMELEGKVLSLVENLTDELP